MNDESQQFLNRLLVSGLVAQEELKCWLECSGNGELHEPPSVIAATLVSRQVLTVFQASAILSGQDSDLFLGNYVLLEEIGRGGMGVVYKARHRHMKRTCAVKILSQTLIANRTALERFQREAEVAARLSHPNIVTAYDSDVSNGTWFLVMEYVQGPNLSEVLQQRGPLNPVDVVDWILQVARGLEYAHQNNVIHRDIKPGNLLLSNDKVVKILDLGLARVEPLGRPLGVAEITESGQVLGTFDYMAPEQAMDTHAADARSDIYSLGCSLYRLITGESVYVADTMMKKVIAHRERPIPDLVSRRGNIPPDLNRLFRRMVAKAPSERIQTMTQVLNELSQVQKLFVPGEFCATQRTEFVGNSSAGSTKRDPIQRDSRTPDVVRKQTQLSLVSESLEPSDVSTHISGTIGNAQAEASETAWNEKGVHRNKRPRHLSRNDGRGKWLTYRKSWFGATITILVGIVSTGFYYASGKLVYLDLRSSANLVETDHTPLRKEKITTESNLISQKSGIRNSDAANVKQTVVSPPAVISTTHDLLSEYTAGTRKLPVSSGWHWDQNALQSDSEVAVNNLKLFAIDSEAYEVDSEFTLLDGESSLYFMLPLKGTHGYFILQANGSLDSQVQTVTAGFGQIGNSEFRGQASTGQIRRPAIGARSRLKISVDIAGSQLQLSAQLDGVSIAAWKGPVSEFSVPPKFDWPEVSIFGVGCLRSTYRIHSLEVEIAEKRKVALSRNEGASEPESVTADLLAQLDLKRNQKQGVWQREGGGIASRKESPRAQLQLSIVPRSDYFLDVDVERLVGTGDLRFGIVVDGNPTSVVIDGTSRLVSGLEYLMGRSLSDQLPEETWRGPALPYGAKTRIRIAVRKNRVIVELNGREGLFWEGEANTLSLSPDWQLAEPNRLWIGCSETTFRISRIELGELPPIHSVICDDRTAAEQMLRFGGRVYIVNEVIDQWSTGPLPAGPMQLIGIQLPSTANLKAGDLQCLNGLRSFNNIMAVGTNLRDHHLEDCKGIPALEYVFLGHTLLTDLGIQKLARHPYLQVLHVPQTAVTDLGIQSLLPLKRLRDVDLSDTAITDQGLGILATIPTLRVLDVQKTNATRSGIELLRTRLPHCRVATDYGELPALQPD